MAVFEYKNGRRAVMSDRYAQILERLGKGLHVLDEPIEEAPKAKVKETKKAEPRAMKAEGSEAPKKREYKRRDMKAED